MKFFNSRKPKQEIKTSQKKKVSFGVVVKNKKNKEEAITTKTVVKHSLKLQGKQIIRKILLSRIFRNTFKILLGILFCYILFYGLYTYFNKSFANDVVISQSEIIDRVAKLTIVPLGAPNAIVRVENAEKLKLQNVFYENIKNGDYIIMYPKMAIIYDLMNNSIVAIKKSE